MTERALEDFGGERVLARCPGCGRAIDVSSLQPGERFKCAKCKKLLRLGPQLFDPRYRAQWQLGRVVLLVGCIGATVWCVTTGYSFGAHTGQWWMGFGGALVVWAMMAGCVALAAATTQNNGVLVGVAALMNGAALFFMERLGQRLGYDTRPWHQYRFFPLWAPSLMLVGILVLSAALVIQRLHRSV